jgi:hypothetical protein
LSCFLIFPILPASFSVQHILMLSFHLLCLSCGCIPVSPPISMLFLFLFLLHIDHIMTCNKIRCSI